MDRMIEDIFDPYYKMTSDRGKPELCKQGSQGFAYQREMLSERVDDWVIVIG